MYASCVAGALQQNEYLEHIRAAGFESVEIRKSKSIVIPDALLEQYFNNKEREPLQKETFGIYSITIVKTKP